MRQAMNKDVQFVAGSARARELAMRAVEARRRKLNPPPAAPVAVDVDAPPPPPESSGELPVSDPFDPFSFDVEEAHVAA